MMKNVAIIFLLCLLRQYESYSSCKFQGNKWPFATIPENKISFKDMHEAKSRAIQEPLFLAFAYLSNGGQANRFPCMTMFLGDTMVHVQTKSFILYHPSKISELYHHYRFSI